MHTLMREDGREDAMKLFAALLLAVVLAACNQNSSVERAEPAPQESPQMLELDVVEVDVAAAPQAAPPRAALPVPTAEQQQATQMVLAEGAVPSAVSDVRKAALLEVLGVEVGEDPGQVLNDCGESITLDFYAAQLGGSVGLAFLVALNGAPQADGCYGETGTFFYLYRTQGETYRLILSSGGHLAILETETNGVKDVAVRVPGNDIPAYAWSGSTYKRARVLPDAEFPKSLNR